MIDSILALLRVAAVGVTLLWTLTAVLMLFEARKHRRKMNK